MIEAPALEVVAHLRSEGEREIELCFFVERTVETASIRQRLIRNGADDRSKLAPELRKERADGSRRHAFVGVVDQRIGNMRVGREEAGVFAAEIERLLQERKHGGKIVRRPCSRPGIIRDGAECIGALDMVWWNFDRLFEVASCDADQACVVRIRREAIGARCKRVQQPAHRRVDQPLVRQPVQRRILAGACWRAARGHVGRLIPVEQASRGGKIIDLERDGA